MKWLAVSPTDPSNECLWPCAATLTLQHINRENYRFSITKANNVNLCVHEQECVKSRGSVCRWVWMEQTLYVKWGQGSSILGSGCLFWTTVLSVHRLLIGYKRSFFFVFFYSDMMVKRSRCYVTTPTSHPHDLFIVRATKCAAIGWNQRGNDEREP